MPEGETESRKQTIQRINRIQGQLNSLKTAIENDRDCEYLVTQAHTIEKALSSLIIHMVEGYIEHQAKILVHEDAEEALRSIKRLFELSHR
ncbi:MAG: metal-sensitive transcriptional regulator [Anaerolineae bacterium]|jgi:DNA-binding FrmR family transcriptional regulator|nr:metal-sensitive transcriptional regulator [Anaerolineae bacterium]